MNTQNIKQKITNIVDDLFEKMGVSHNGVEEVSVAGQTLYCINIDNTNDSELIIGSRGDGLRSINMIVGRIFEKELGGERLRITIDINNYKKGKIEAVVQAATEQANKVKESKEDVEMLPQNGYERMLVHAALADIDSIETGSIGEGYDRRVVIKFVG
jgi:spoIIIJ-associated protein